MSRMTYMRSWKSLRLTSHTWLGLNPQIGRPLSRIVVPLVYLFFLQTRQMLVTSLIVPQLLYCDVIFSKSSARLRERLKLAFNSCARYIYGISRYEQISNYTNRILGVPLDVYYSMRICCMINKIIKSGGSRYLFHELRFVQSSRLFNLLVPVHSLNARACSLFVQGTILWNDLAPAVKRGGSMGKFILLVLYLLLGKYISKLIETPVLHTQLSFRSTNF
jgi:hypothetical protein